MQIWDEIEIIDTLPAIFIPSIQAVCIADLHLGYEGLLAEELGVFMPKTQFKEEMEMLRKIFRETKPKLFVLNGDVKHEFSETSYHEYREVSELFRYLEKKVEKIIVVKGNHDNYIERVTSKFEKIEVYEKFESGDFIFVHGHKPVSLGKLKGKILILAHEHPSIGLYSEIGTKEKIKCFLYGESRKVKVLVLPAFSSLSLGSEVNLLSQKDFLSPILRSLRVEEFEVIGVEKDIGVFRFAKLKELMM